MSDNTTTDGSVAAPGSIGSGTCRSYRTTPCEPAPGLSGAVAGVPTPPHIPPDENGDLPSKQTRPSKCNPHVFEAMRLMVSYGYIPVRLTESELPVSIIGFKEPEPLIVAVISARRPVPKAETLRRLYEPQVLSLCHLAGTRKYRIMIWVHSPKCGWRYYKVSPGGLEYDWNFPNSL